MSGLHSFHWLATGLALAACAGRSSVPDELLTGRDPFALGGIVEVDHFRGVETELARAIVAARQAGDDRGVQLLRAWLDHHSRAPDDLRRRALLSLGDAEAGLGHYSAAAIAFEQALGIEPATVSEGARRSAAFWRALANEAPPRRLGAAGATAPLVLDRANLLRVDVRLGDIVVPMIIDTGAEVSVIRASLARTGGLRPVGTQLTVGTSTAETQFDLQIARTVAIGEAVVENVPFIIQQDAAMTFAGGDYEIQGILGVQVLRAWERVAWVDHGTRFLVGAAVPAPVSDARALFWHDIGVGLQVDFGAHTAPVQLDTGANKTELNEIAVPWLGGAETLGLRSATTVEEGLGGREVSQVQRANQVSFSLAGARVTLNGIDISSSASTPDGARLGGDILRQVSLLALDFEVMRYYARQ